MAAARGEPAGLASPSKEVGLGFRSCQLGKIPACVLQRRRVDAPAALDQLAARLIGLRVVHRQHAFDQPVPEVEDGKRSRLAIAAPHRGVFSRRLAAVLEVDVVLIGPEVRDLGVGQVTARNRRRDAAAVVLRDLPVLDANRTPKNWMLVKRHITADVNAIGGAQSFVDPDASAFDRQAQRPGHLQVRLDLAPQVE